MKYNTMDEIGRNWDIQECMDLYNTKQKAKETHEAQFGVCSEHKRKAKYLCDEDSKTF